MNEELEKFNNSHNKENNYKLIVDFEKTKVNFDGKPLEIENIKYKKTKKELKQQIVDLKKSKKQNDLF